MPIKDTSFQTHSVSVLRGKLWREQCWPLWLRFPSSQTSLFSVPEKGNSLRINRTRPADRLTPALPKLLPSTTPRTNITASPVTNLPSNGDSLHGQTTKAPSRAPEKHPNTAGNLHLLLPSVYPPLGLTLDSAMNKPEAPWLLYFDRLEASLPVKNVCFFQPYFIHTAAVRAQDGSSLLRSALATERVRPSTWGNAHLTCL